MRMGPEDMLPLPSRISVHSVEVRNRSHKVSREHSGNGSTGVKNARSLCQFVFAVCRSSRHVSPSKRTIEESNMQCVGMLKLESFMIKKSTYTMNR